MHKLELFFIWFTCLKPEAKEERLVPLTTWTTPSILRYRPSIWTHSFWSQTPTRAAFITTVQPNWAPVQPVYGGYWFEERNLSRSGGGRHSASCCHRQSSMLVVSTVFSKLRSWTWSTSLDRSQLATSWIILLQATRYRPTINAVKACHA